MKKLTLILLAPFFSCSPNSAENAESGNVLENFSFTVDTVVVDSGNEIINLASGMQLADFSADKKKLYIFNDVNQSLAVVDMEKLKLEEKIQFELEGPNGTGRYSNKIQILSGNRIVINSFGSNAIFNFQGNKENNIKLWSENIDSLSKDSELNAWFGLMLSKDEKKLFSLPGDFFEGGRDFLIADFPSQKGKLIDIPAMDIASTLRVVLKVNEMMNVNFEEVFAQEFNGKIIISNSASSDIYRYDISQDLLQLKTYQHNLVPNRKEVVVRSEVTTGEEFISEMTKINEQIGFERFFEDPKTKRYYRFAKINLPKPTTDAVIKADVFLLAYDEDFNLIGETKVDELTHAPKINMIKDGKFWSYVNVEDELGFAVMDFKF